MIVQVRAILYELMVSESNRQAARMMRVFLTLLISVNVAVSILGTVSALSQIYGSVFYYINLISVVIFVIEYLVRVWVCVEDGRSSVLGRIKFMASPMMLIDLVAIVPAFLPQGVVDLRTIRVFRLLRILKLSRHSRALRVMLTVVQSKRNELGATAFVGFLMLIAASTVVYYLEFPVQPEVFSSIPATMWWGVATLTTVGYGDMAPVTPLGRIAGAVVATIGVGMFALPAAILSSGFVEHLKGDSEPDGQV
ncbi:ion transporter [Lujinxingia vulgaris]|uniref:Ion transporter n=1 Tax=Lujinxingia vulgaris TaxID=2600176 RepID=A0A5C6XBK2_9DELT|nr:ion transporter [Lujinxingia vulgaris]TXD39297.1 ion transporter [Lujinxingia vulgaris]